MRFNGNKIKSVNEEGFGKDAIKKVNKNIMFRHQRYWVECKGVIPPENLFNRLVASL